LSSRWKNFDESKIAEILSLLADGPKHFDELFTELKARRVAGSRTTLNQYLNHLMEENRVKKIVSPVKGKRIAYELISEEDLAHAQQAENARIQAEQTREPELDSTILPTTNPLDPNAIKVIRENYRPEPKPTPEDYISIKLYGLVCTMLRELKIQLENYKGITESGDAERKKAWIEFSFDRIIGLTREIFAKIALLQIADHYTHDELMDAVDTLYWEYLDILVDLEVDMLSK
jgi:DNA-binding HxlR family transcriptional regulator